MTNEWFDPAGGARTVAALRTVLLYGAATRRLGRYLFFLRKEKVTEKSGHCVELKAAPRRQATPRRPAAARRALSHDSRHLSLM